MMEARFWSKVDVRGPDECWLWKAALSDTGYGRFRVSDERSSVEAHRVAYELVVGSVPEGLHLDHLCRVRRCVNPTHLEPVTCRENILRGASLAAERAQQTECKHGHPFTAANTIHRPGRGGRDCLECRRRRSREGARRRAAMKRGA